MPHENLKYKIGIGLIPGIGPITAKKLIAYTGSIEGVFNETHKNLLKIPGIGEQLARQIYDNKNVIETAEKEIEYIQKSGIQYSYFLDSDYPGRLKNCEDSPIILFYKGNIEFNKSKVLSVVGTRNATEYGKGLVNQLISDLSERGHDVVIVSGLAYGIDICAHKAALRNGLQTAAVLAHGLSTIYPGLHKSTATEIINQGALVTDFISDVLPERNNFVKRNRLIAGLADATLVAESALKGGALITADLASSYNRDVLAFPGRCTDLYSRGCNWLIKSNKAAMVENIDDLEYHLGWEIKQNNKPIQTELFTELGAEEQIITDILRERGELPIDIISIHANMPVSKISALLLTLEFAGLVRSMPGKVYRLFR